MSRLGVAPDRITINARIDHAIKQGKLDEAIETFEQALDGVSQPRQIGHGVELCKRCSHA